MIWPDLELEVPQGAKSEEDVVFPLPAVESETASADALRERSVKRAVPSEFAYVPTLQPEDHFARGKSEWIGFNSISSRVLHSDKYRAMVPGSIGWLLYKYFGFPSGYEHTGPVPHVVNLLEEMFKGGSIVANFATDHCKSLGATFFFPILSLMENPDEAHIVVGSNLNDSRRRLQMVQRELETNQELIKDFPWLKKPPKPKDGGGTAWSRTELTVVGRSANRPNPSIYACATGSSDIRGRRGKLIMDDVEGEEHKHSAQKRRDLYDFVKYEGVRCLEDKHESPRPLLIALGTPFHPDSIYFRLEREDWRTLRIPAYTVEWRRVQEYNYLPGGEHKRDWSLEERKNYWVRAGARIPSEFFTWPLKRLKVLSQDPFFGAGKTKAQFSLAYLLDPSEGNPGRLSLNEIDRLMRETEFPEAADWKTFVCFDPASGSDTRWADYCGIAVVRLRWPRNEKLPEVQVLDSIPYEEGVVEQVDLLADLAREYECEVLYESNAQQGATYRDLFAHRQRDIRLIPFFTKHTSKFDEEMGLTVVKTLVRQSRLTVPQSRLESEGVQRFQHEIRDLGTDRVHDHLCCAVWFAVRYLYEQVKAYSGPPLVGGGAIRSPFGSGLRSGTGALNWRNWRT